MANGLSRERSPKSIPHPALIPTALALRGAGESQRGWNHLFDYIEVYYNRQRLHSTIGYLSSEAFEAKQAA